MKQLILICVCVASAIAWPAYSNDGPALDKAHVQQDINRLLYKVTEPIRERFAHLKDAAKNFDPTADYSMYKDGGEAAKHLYEDLEDHRLLEQHHWFSLFNNRHREESLMLFDVLMACKTHSCFIHNAAYYREHMNEGEFVYALYVAVIHSDLTHGIVLPPLYEITPHMFTNSEVIQQAYTAKMTQKSGEFYMPFTGSKRNPEQRVAYFGEDVGMNSHHVNWHMDFPFWWNDEKYGHHIDRKGELFYWVHHQLTARFDAERLSNNLDVVDELHWDKEIIEGFAPHTTYRYGGEFPTRPDNIYFDDVEGVAKVRDMLITESRIRDAIAHGYIDSHDGTPINIRDEHGIDVLGDIIESSLYSPNPEYYGALHNTAHIMLGRQADPQGKFNMPPGVMEHFETATRDPSFFRLHKYMNNIFKEHKDSLPPYTKDDLLFEGIAVESVTVEGKLETFFENYTFDLQMAVDDSEKIEDVEVTAKVPRLNHEDFALNFDIMNNNGADKLATIRVFLCPKYDYNHIPYNMETGRYGCIEIDKFWETLHGGQNKITRKSSESSVTVPDRMHYADIMLKADEAVEKGEELHLEEFVEGCGIPNRMLLPKGKKSGMYFVLAVAVTDGEEDLAVAGFEKEDHKRHFAHCGVHGEKYPDKKPLGYPLDRKVPDTRVFFETPNFYRTYVKIYHNDHH